MIYNAIPIGCTWSDLIKKSQRANRKFTYPTFGFRGMTSIVTLHWTLVVLFEWLPSTLCDTILGLVGAKKRYNDIWKYPQLSFQKRYKVYQTYSWFWKISDNNSQKRKVIAHRIDSKSFQYLLLPYLFIYNIEVLFWNFIVLKFLKPRNMYVCITTINRINFTTSK